jgi:hypothetical protein
MSLVTEVFDSWAAEPLQKQPLPYAQSQPDPYAQRYYVQQQYPTGQAWEQPPPQAYQPAQVQAAYNYPSPAQLPAQLAGNPVAPVMPSPAPSYSNPVPQNAMPHAPYGYGPPQSGAIEMLAELPAEIPMATLAPAQVPAPVALSVPVQPVSTDVSSSSFALLARDLWGADSDLEEEKVHV